MVPRRPGRVLYPVSAIPRGRWVGVGSCGPSPRAVGVPVGLGFLTFPSFALCSLCRGVEGSKRFFVSSSSPLPSTVPADPYVGPVPQYAERGFFSGLFLAKGRGGGGISGDPEFAKQEAAGCIRGGVQQPRAHGPMGPWGIHGPKPG